MVPEHGRQVGPLDLRHHSPKVMRASSSLRRRCSSGSRVRVKPSASSKNRFLSCSRVSRPDSSRTSANRLLAELIESGLETRAPEGKRFFEPADGLTRTRDPEEKTRLKEEAARMTL